MDRKVALITGASSGIGLKVAERLLLKHQDLRLCLACRSEPRAQKARLELLSVCPGTDVAIIRLDVSCIQSVYDAAMEIKQRYKRLDFIYLNAGIMPVSSVNWTNFWNGLFSKNAANMFLTGDGLLCQEDSLTPENLQKVFTTNVLGHFILVSDVTNILGGSMEEVAK